MKIKIHHIPSNGLTLVYNKDPGYFATIKDLMERGECRFPVAIDIELSVLPVRDFFEVKGDVTTTAGLFCSRCLADIEHQLNRSFKLIYSRKIPKDIHGVDPEGIELTAEQIGVIFFRGDEIDFSDALQEQVMLALPYKPLCKEDCKGLCPHCGIDLNKAVCQCNTRRVNGPFDALKDLTLPSH